MFKMMTIARRFSFTLISLSLLSPLLGYATDCKMYNEFDLKAVSTPQLGITSLKVLGVDDDSISNIKFFPNLIYLDLASANTGDGSIPHVTQLTHLNHFNLFGQAVTDQALPDIGHLTCLTSLNLKATRISGSTLRSLNTLSLLETLNVSNTNVSREDVDLLKQDLPNVEIIAENIRP